MTGVEVGGVGLGTAILLLAMAVGAVVALSLFVAVVKGFLYICRPNEILIFSGRKHTLPDGSSTGYKVVRRGWAIRIPILETVNRMDMRLFMVEVGVTNAYSKNGIPLDVSGEINGHKFVNPAEFRKVLLTREDDFRHAVVRKVLSYALGRGIQGGDRPAIEQIVGQVKAHGDSFSSVIMAVVESFPFQNARGGKAMDPGAVATMPKGDKAPVATTPPSPSPVSLKIRK